jgi:glycosyltransferase involved in cell wall biosynthesis
MTILYLILFTILIATISFSLGAWLYFLLHLIKSISKSPTLELRKYHIKYPRVSVIVPALNEEENISQCLDSLLNQDYSNFEIVVVNASSSDTTAQIMHRYQIRNPGKILSINAGSKPFDWVGKNWACYQGYLNANGDIFVFIDADTVLSSPSVIASTVRYLIEQEVDALTARPNVVCNSTWAKIVFPILWTLSHIKYSALFVNDVKNKTGYFFGCFFVISRRAYELGGTHQGVKNEIVEDAMLGQKIKGQKFKLKMVRGEHCIDTLITGDFRTIWQGLKRCINLIPFCFNNIITNICIIFVLLLQPFMLLPFSFYLASLQWAGSSNTYSAVFLIINLTTIISIVCSINMTQLRISLSYKTIYILLCPLACIVVSIGFISFIIKPSNRRVIIWRGTEYVIGKRT